MPHRRKARPFGTNQGTSFPIAAWAIVAAVALGVVTYFVMRSLH
jgi:hypothetical protein